MLSRPKCFGRSTRPQRAIWLAPQVEDKDDPWNLLTPQEKQMAEQLRLGRESAKEIGDALSLTPGSVYTYFKRIKAKTGWSKQALAVQAAARREASGR